MGAKKPRPRWEVNKDGEGEYIACTNTEGDGDTCFEVYLPEDPDLRRAAIRVVLRALNDARIFPALTPELNRLRFLGRLKRAVKAVNDAKANSRQICAVMTTREVETAPLRELAVRRMRPGLTRELFLRLPDRLEPGKLVERLTAILEAAEVEAEAAARVSQPVPVGTKGGAERRRP